MPVKYGRKKYRQNNIFYTVITVILLCTVFLSMVGFFYGTAEDEAYEMLHIQTKQIKDDIALQIKSDRENLVTMANFASKLYADGEGYNLMFESFKPIGLFSNIGILNPDNTFVTMRGKGDLGGKISFEDEKKRGSYISGRVNDLTLNDREIIRSAVPIVSEGETVGILYGVIRLETIARKYNNMAKELDAQLFVYDKEYGKFVIDTFNKTPGVLTDFKDRVFNEGYSYEELVSTDKGYTSFKSILTGEDLYVHYSTIDDCNWGIMLARYESQVFAETHKIFAILLFVFAIMVAIMALYMLILMSDERRRSDVTKCASMVRKTLLETSQQQNNINEALKQVCVFAKADAAIFVDTDGEDFNYVQPEHRKKSFELDEKTYFMQELFRYGAELYKVNNTTVGVMCIIPNEHLAKTDPKLLKFFKKYKIKEISFATVTNKDNHVTIIGVINPARSRRARLLAEDIAVCFSIALYNKKHLNRTEKAASTDSLTGVANRVQYKKDVYEFDEERPQNFACIFIDVNELHMVNNKYGHAAGDEMLLYIANTLKEVFYGHKVYRMGGDEFLVFAQGVEADYVGRCTERLVEEIEEKDYHVAIGVSYRTQNTNTEEMVREAEVRMYESKAQYYQNKEQANESKNIEEQYVQIKTGILEIDAMLSILKEHYNGIYRVSLDNDRARRIIMPAYLGYNENEEQYSKLLEKYINEIVHPDSHRAVLSFLNYDAIRRQLLEGNIPKIKYRKINGENVVLSVYKLSDTDDTVRDTLWVFAKD